MTFLMCAPGAAEASQTAEGYQFRTYSV
jgi:hypothetical protein